MRSITSGDRLAQQFGPRAAIVQGQAFLSKRSRHLRLVRGQTRVASLATSGRLPTDNHFGQPASTPCKPIINRKTAARNWLRLMSSAEARFDAWASTSRTSEVPLDVRPSSHRKYLRCTERPRLLLG